MVAAATIDVIENKIFISRGSEVAELLHGFVWCCGNACLGLHKHLARRQMEISACPLKVWCCRAPRVWSLQVKPGEVSPVEKGAFAWGAELSPRAQKILKVMQSRAWLAEQTQHSKCICGCCSIRRMCKQAAPGVLVSCNTRLDSSSITTRYAH